MKPKTGTVVVGFLDPGTWSACFGLSLSEMYLYDAVNNHRIIRQGVGQLRSLCGTGGVPSARNDTVVKFLDQTDGEWLFFIDSDMGFAPDTVDRLVASADRYHMPVMGGLCFQLKRKDTGPFHAERFLIAPTVYDYIEADDEIGFRPIADYKLDGIQQVAGTGAACMLIHRRVLDKIRAKYGDVWFDPFTHPTGARGKPRTFSEDLSFCVRVQSVEVPIHVDTSVKTCHEKGGVFLDEEAFDKQQAFGVFEKSMQVQAEVA